MDGRLGVIRVEGVMGRRCRRGKNRVGGGVWRGEGKVGRGEEDWSEKDRGVEGIVRVII
jgi:hypothetical protein